MTKSVPNFVKKIFVIDTQVSLEMKLEFFSNYVK